MVWRTGIVLFLWLSLSGCGTLVAAQYGIPIVPPSNREAVTAHTIVQPDPHEGSTTIWGPRIFHDHSLTRHNYRIRSWLNPRKPDIDNAFELQVIGVFEKRVYLQQAYAYGHEMKTKVLDREKLCFDCHTLETIGIPLTEQEMEDYARSGLDFEVLGRRAKVVMSIPPDYFAAVLDIHRRHRAGPSS